MRHTRVALGAVLTLGTSGALAQQASPPARALAPRVGPERGTVIVVGGGTMGPEIYEAFLTAAGGPEALLVEVPNAGGADAYPQNGPGMRGWRQAGARRIHTYFTKDRAVADADSFVAVLREAGGVWFQGGRQFRLVDAYGGTRSEAEFRAVLDRGGVVGGSSAGASILGSFLVRGAPSNDNLIMDYPGYQRGFGYLRDVGVDQHVVARERLADLADSIVTRHPHLLGISEDEGTAWVIRGDTGTIIGRGKAFVYNGNDPNDPGKPFLTLYPGDEYDLGARRVRRRAYEGTGVSPAFIDSLLAPYRDVSLGGATLLVARGGKVLANRAFGVPPQRRYMPETTVPLVALGEMSAIFAALCDQLPEPPARPGSAPPDSAGAGSSAVASGGGAPAPRGGVAAPAGPTTALQRCLSQRVGPPVGLRKTSATPDGEVLASVDELYRVSLGLDHPPTYRASREGGRGGEDTQATIDPARGWLSDHVQGVVRHRAFVRSGGRRGAFVRLPERAITVILLTNDDAADASRIADRIVERLLQR